MRQQRAAACPNFYPAEDTMADPKWFDEDAYLANKLVQLQTIEPEKG